MQEENQEGQAEGAASNGAPAEGGEACAKCGATGQELNEEKVCKTCAEQGQSM